eukprot:COSAG01_NODE_16_length_40091_cov_15.728646_10_plen_252_part_00
MQQPSAESGLVRTDESTPCKQPRGISVWMRPVLTEIYLRHACSCQEEIEDGSASGQALGGGHLLRVRLLAALLRAAVQAGGSSSASPSSRSYDDDGRGGGERPCWATALAAAEALLPSYRRCYPPRSPMLGLHLATLAKLRQLLGQPQVGALQWVKWVKWVKWVQVPASTGGSCRGVGWVCGEAERARRWLGAQGALAAASEGLDVLRLTHAADGDGARPQLQRVHDEAELELRSIHMQQQQQQQAGALAR